MIYLDTHIVIWLYAGLLEKFNQTTRTLLNENEILISPVVRLELQYLFEIGRITKSEDVIVSGLGNQIGLILCDSEFNAVINQSLSISWTRDPFDRMIVAQASLTDSILVTKDNRILENYTLARW